VTMTDPNEYREQPEYPSQESDPPISSQDSDQTMIKSNLQESAASHSDESMLDSGFVSALQIRAPEDHEQQPFFTERQKVAMEEHRKYYTSMIRYINGKEKGQDADLPKKPKSSIAFLEVEKTKAATKEDLHLFLLKYYVADEIEEVLTEDHMSNFQKLTSLDDMKTYLKRGYLLLKKRNVRTLDTSLKVGVFLQKTKQLFERKKGKKESWKNFLDENINISCSYANKLIHLSLFFYSLPKFHKLAICVNTLYSKSKSIVQRMEDDEEFGTFWKN